MTARSNRPSRSAVTLKTEPDEVAVRHRMSTRPWRPASPSTSGATRGRGRRVLIPGSVVVLRNVDGAILAEAGGRQVYQIRVVPPSATPLYSSSIQVIVPCV